MSLRAFIACGYALLVEAHQSAGANLIDAIERADESMHLPKDEGGNGSAPNPADNTAALNELQSMLAGTVKA